MNLRSTLAYSVLGLALLTPVVAAAALTSAGKSLARFSVSGPLGLQINGETSGVNVSESGGTITVKVPTGAFKTGMDLRDEHLKTTLHAAEHPYAYLTVKRSELSFPTKDKPTKGTAKARFKLNGIEKPVVVNYSAKTKDDGVIRAAGDLTIDIQDYGIAKPCYLGVCTDTKVNIVVKFRAKDS